MVKSQRIQRRPWNLRAIASLTLLFVLSVSLLGQGKQPPAAIPEFVDAEGVVKARDAVGPQLVAILADEKRPDEDRVEAAIWLGKMQYTPAIPMLIKYIKLEKPALVVRDGPEFPCQDALIDFGDAAVPSLVDAFMAVNEHGQDRLICLWMAIAHKSRPAAWTYAKGLEATNPNPDPRFKYNMEVLLLRIKPVVKPERQKTTP